MRSFGRSLFVFLMVVVGLVVGNVSSAQETGAISGTVVLGDNGEPVHGTLVLIIELRRSTTVNHEGRFEFEGVPVGDYEILAQREHLTAERQQVSVAAGTTAEVDFYLELSPIHESVTVTAGPSGEVATLEAFNTVTSLDWVELMKNPSISVGAILEEDPGVAKRSFGPGSERPIIRGFDGDRVLVMQDGIRTGDLSSQSADHGVTLDPSGLRRLELVKGPVTLLYGSNAIGGVVNAVTPHEAFIRTQLEGFLGQVSVDGGTTNDQAGANGQFQFGQGNWAVWGGASGRRTDDYDTPEGPVVNSASRLSNGRAGVGYYTEKAYFSAGYQRENGRFGIPFAGEFHAHGHEEEEDHHEEEEDHHEEEELFVDVDTGRQSARFDAGLRNLDNRLFDAFRVVMNYIDYTHDEVETLAGVDTIATTFDNNVFVIRAEAEQRRTEELNGKFGVEATFRDYNAVGEEALAPATTQGAFAAFAYEELQLPGAARLQFGGRLEYNDYQPEERGELGHMDEGEEHEGEEDHEDEHTEEGDQHTDLEPPEARQRSFTGVSGSVGLHVDVTTNTVFVANLTRSYRAPALEELYNFGPHVGTLAFEVGNPDLEREASIGVDLSLRNHSRLLQGEFNVYYYDIDNFVFPAYTDELVDGLLLAPFLQGDSRFVGFDAKGVFSVHRNLFLDVSAGYVNAELTDTDEPLPRIPPFHGRIGFSVVYEGLNIEPEVVLASKQDKIFRDETLTEGYTVVNVVGSYTLARGHSAHIFAVRGYNLTNELYRNHTSFIKDLAPEIGRGVKVSYSFRFF